MAICLFLVVNHLPQLITDLALILGTAGITTIIFRWLKQPIVLGYLLSGFLVGPNVSLLPTVSDTESVRVWADIGVIFLLFALGLEFSFKKLAKVGAASGITAAIEITAMMLIGYMAGRAMGWSNMDCIYLGGIIAISSTTIIFRAFDELGLKAKQFTNLVFGVLIVEDLVAIIMMVLLSTAAISKTIEGTTMLLAIGKMLFFLTLWFLLGIFLLPTILKRSSKWLGNETLLVAVVGLCFGMVALAGSVGFSSALGAFIVGSILSETIYGERIEGLIKPLKHLFGGVFFVSVGMLINPLLLWENIGPVLLLTVLVIGGKLLFVSLGSLLAGKDLKQSIEAGTAMTQIGEFSFIIATVGISLEVTSDYLYPVAVGVSVITTFTTPYLIQLAKPIDRWLEKHLPRRLLLQIEKYTAGSQTLKNESHWNKVFRSYGQVIIIHSVISMGIILGSRYYLKPLMNALISNQFLATAIAVVVSILAISPFIYAIAARKIQGLSYKALWIDSKYNRGPLVMLEALRNLIAVVFIGILLGQYFPLWLSLLGTVIVLAVVLLVFRQRLQKFYERIEERFLHNLNQRELHAVKHRELTPWDTHLSVLKVGANSRIAGSSLKELKLREDMGINVAYIERGNQTIYVPEGNVRIFPHDVLGVIGSDQAMQNFELLLNDYNQMQQSQHHAAELIVLEKFRVNEGTHLKDLSIRESRIHELTDGLVVGIERNGKRIYNPSSDTIFLWDDLVWLVGNRKKIHEHFLH